jgi:hypothetical protein
MIDNWQLGYQLIMLIDNQTPSFDISLVQLFDSRFCSRGPNESAKLNDTSIPR